MGEQVVFGQSGTVRQAMRATRQGGGQRDREVVDGCASSQHAKLTNDIVAPAHPIDEP